MRLAHALNRGQRYAEAVEVLDRAAAALATTVAATTIFLILRPPLVAFDGYRRRPRNKVRNPLQIANRIDPPQRCSREFVLFPEPLPNAFEVC
jgi:hypothetical protein